MKNYKFIDGISVVKVCDYYLIVSTTDAWKDVSKIQVISKIGIQGLSMLIDGVDKSRIIYHLSKLSKKSEEKTKQYFEAIITCLINKGFLIEGN